jgi:hypothetical protein
VTQEEAEVYGCHMFASRLFIEWKNNWYNQVEGQRRDQRQHSNLYNIAFEFKSLKNLMLPSSEVDPYLVDILPYGAPTHKDTEEINRVTRMINRVPESEHRMCPASDDEDGDYLNYTEEHNCFWTISDADPLDDATWIRRKQGIFAFMDKDAYDNLPTFVDDVDVHEKEHFLDWVEEGEEPESTNNMKDTHGCL